MKLLGVFPSRRVLLSSALILALWAIPVTYYVENGHWQANGAYADDDECDDDSDCGVDGVDVAISLGDGGVIILSNDHGIYTGDDE